MLKTEPNTLKTGPGNHVGGLRFWNGAAVDAQVVALGTPIAAVVRLTVTAMAYLTKAGADGAEQPRLSQLGHAPADGERGTVVSCREVLSLCGTNWAPDASGVVFGVG